MPVYTKFREKDIDGRWFEFDHQQLGNSCTMASAKMAKEFYTNRIIGEQALRGIATLFEFKATNTEVSPLAQIVTNSHDWETTPGNWTLSVKVLKSQPLPIPGAKQTQGLDHIRVASRNHPILIGWSWTGGGGHCTICVGVTKADPNLAVILDPGYGLQYVNLDEAIGMSLPYKPIDKQTGNVMTTGRHYPGSNTFIVT